MYEIYLKVFEIFIKSVNNNYNVVMIIKWYNIMFFYQKYKYNNKYQIFKMNYK